MSCSNCNKRPVFSNEWCLPCLDTFKKCSTCQKAVPIFSRGICESCELVQAKPSVIKKNPLCKKCNLNEFTITYFPDFLEENKCDGWCKFCVRQFEMDFYQRVRHNQFDVGSRRFS